MRLISCDQTQICGNTESFRIGEPVIMIGKSGILTPTLFDINQSTDCGAGTAQTDLYLLADRGQRFHKAPEEDDLARIRLGRFSSIKVRPMSSRAVSNISARACISPNTCMARAKKCIGTRTSPFSMRRTVDMDDPIRSASDAWDRCLRLRANARSLPNL